MDNGKTYKISGFATGYNDDIIEFDYDTTPPKQLGHPCRICLEYYDISCMCIGRGSSNGICKICNTEYSEEYYTENRERKLVQMKEYWKEYYVKNKDELNRKDRARYKRKKEAINY